MKSIQQIEPLGCYKPTAHQAFEYQVILLRIHLFSQHHWASTVSGASGTWSRNTTLVVPHLNMEGSCPQPLRLWDSSKTAKKTHRLHSCPWFPHLLFSGPWNSHVLSPLHMKIYFKERPINFVHCGGNFLSEGHLPRLLKRLIFNGKNKLVPYFKNAKLCLKLEIRNRQIPFRIKSDLCRDLQEGTHEKWSKKNQIHCPVFYFILSSPLEEATFLFPHISSMIFAK